MTLKLKEAVALNGLFMVARDEQGKEQVFMRIWQIGNKRPSSSGESMMWLQGGTLSNTFINLDQEQCKRMDLTMLPQMRDYAVRLIDPKEAV